MLEVLNMIETLLAIVTNPDNMDTISYKTLLESQSFKEQKLTLINLISINNIINNFNPNPSFNLKKFLYDGATTKDGQKLNTPTIDSRYEGKEKEFYLELYRALIEENYVPYEKESIYISSEKLETIIDKEWLYGLSVLLIKDNKKRLFLLNKLKPKRIENQAYLIKYLEQYKSFICEPKNKQQQGFNKEYLQALEAVKKYFTNKEEIKIDKVIDIFKSQIDDKYEISISKRKLPESAYIIKRVNEYKEFYTLPLSQQQDLINEWYMQYIEYNDNNLITLQNILLTDKISSKEFIKKNQKKLLTSLLTIYLILVSKYDINYENVSLAKFKLEKYEDTNTISNQIRKKKLDKLIEGLDNADYKKSLIEEIERIEKEIEQQDFYDDQERLAELKNEYEIMKKKYQETEINILNYKNESDILSEKIRYGKKESLPNLQFDYERVSKLLFIAAKKGVITINPLDDKTIIFEIYYDELGNQMFKAKLKISELLEFVEDLNNKIVETQPKR